MKKTKETRKNRGITLIALVITIIVLLILAGISIAMLTGNNGILTQAGKAKEKTATAKTEELVRLSVSDALIAGNGTVNLDELNNGLEKIGYTGDKIKEFPAVVSIAGKTYIISQNGTITKNKWYYENNTTITDGNIKLQLGDYINYDPTNYEGYDPATAKVETTKDETGYDTTQVFNLSSYRYGWRVLGIDSKTGGIELISEDTIEPDSGGVMNTLSKRTSYALNGYTGYVNGGKSLDKISSLYGNGKYSNGARSISINDIKKLDDEIEHIDDEITFYWNGTAKPQYVRKGQKIYSQEGSVMGTYEKGFYWIDENEKLQVSPKSSTASKENLEEIQTIKSDLYQTNYTSALHTDNKIGELLFKNKNDTDVDADDELSFWLSSKSRYVSMYYDVIGINYGYDCFKYGKSLGGGPLFTSSASSYTETLGVRPIVILDSNIKLVSSGENSWSISE